MIVPSGLSSIFGWISIACWIVVYSPQIYENYALQSGQGLSVAFVLIWLFGDFCNLIGALFAGLLPTIIILDCYYVLCDVTLFCQIYYYRWKHSRPVENGENEPLLGEEEQDKPTPLRAKTLTMRYTAAVIFVCLVGTTAWWISGEGEQKGTPGHTISRGNFWKSQIFGWLSCMSFIGARIPQIIKNFKTRCKGLSPALFFFAICGNAAFGASILSKRMDRDYIILNASWLTGSLLVVTLDIAVLCQFGVYRARDE
ncbi:hypothetical protein Agabi119p4_7275 [Agaricus bisporus var. burnettii]|uniref:PQ-loop-domain-containing protein n=1 Tax=Agaricus bisporus var. burnettii TaxID=192524 RepID=A0A8H7C7A9_AGABI|nr:hypothetical protein Agabi119p4_7275 [Agaricus bisporus var. burnettii]